MRKKTRDELPNPKAFRCSKAVSPIEKLRAYDKLDFSEEGRKNAHDHAVLALARMKELEKQLKLHSVRVDGRTVLCSNKAENLDMRVKEYTNGKRLQTR